MGIAIHKGYLPGCIGRITELHARYYNSLAGFELPFEAKVARELGEFCERYDEQPPASSTHRPSGCSPRSAAEVQR